MCVHIYIYIYIYTLNTYHLLVFNFTETMRSMYSCIFYFVDDGIAHNEESLEFFSFSAFNNALLEFEDFRAHWILSKPICNNLGLLCYLETGSLA